MRTYTTTFEEVSVHATFRWKDVETGKTRQRTKKFLMTLNPWNKNEDGTVRNRADIYRALKLQQDAWIAEMNLATNTAALPGDTAAQGGK